MTFGLVCDACDALNPVNASACGFCGHALKSRSTGNRSPIQAAAPSPVAVKAQKPAATCRSCRNEIQEDQPFCGHCGARIEAPAVRSSPAAAPRSLVPEPQSSPGKARLILIKGEGLDGLSYALTAPVHVAGRLEGDLRFADDSLLSPRHASFFYRGTDVYVRDELSTNGIFVRMRDPMILAPNQAFLVGEQLLHIIADEDDGIYEDPTATYLYSSPRKPARMSLVQRLAGGDLGMIFRARSESISIGREGNDVNFPEDPFLSGHHAVISAIGDQRFRLTDVGSKNGTFVRILDEMRLEHGDYVFLGQQLLRVESP